MTHEITRNRIDLTKRLCRAVNNSQQSRLARALKRPYRLFFPKIIALLGQSKEKKARTFWGGKMNVLLPEIVSTHIWRYGFFEADVCSFLISYLKEGMSLVDIGGHYGFFSLFASYLVGEKGSVYTFEPMPHTYRELQKNVGRNSPYPNIETYEIAAYSETDRLEFYDYGLEYSAYNSAFGLREPAVGVENKRVMVTANKIDDFVREKGVEKIDFVKIDAESTEIHVLAGMRRTLEEHKPILIVELGDFGIGGVPKSNEIVKWLQDRNYSAYEYDAGRIIPHLLHESYQYCNLLFMTN